MVLPPDIVVESLIIALPTRIAELDRAIERLRQKISAEELRLAEVEQLAASVAVEATAAAGLPWLREPLRIENVARLRDSSTASDELARCHDIGAAGAGAAPATPGVQYRVTRVSNRS